MQSSVTKLYGMGQYWITHAILQLHIASSCCAPDVEHLLSWHLQSSCGLSLSQSTACQHSSMLQNNHSTSRGMHRNARKWCKADAVQKHRNARAWCKADAAVQRHRDAPFGTNVSVLQGPWTCCTAPASVFLFLESYFRVISHACT